MLNLNCSVNILVCICISSHHLITGVDIACLHVYDLTYYVVFFFTPAPLYTNSCFTSLCPPHPKPPTISFLLLHCNSTFNSLKPLTFSSCPPLKPFCSLWLCCVLPHLCVPPIIFSMVTAHLKHPAVRGKTND